MYKLVLLRHGESTWNKKGLFTGWTDVDLTKRGIEEARAAGQALKKGGYVFDLAYTSFLKRAKKTLRLALIEMKKEDLPVIEDWRLNERHYGNLQGLNKIEMVKKYGEQQVLIWRRSYDIPPPKISRTNPYNQKNDARYRGIIVPEAESLKDVVARVKDFWREEMVPCLKSGHRPLVAASGNSLRAIVKYLDKLSPTKIAAVNIPTGIPLVYELDDSLRPIRSYYLADKKDLEQAISRVKNQTVVKK